MLNIHVGCPPFKSVVIRNCTAQAADGPAPLLSGVCEKLTWTLDQGSKTWPGYHVLCYGYAYAGD